MADISIAAFVKSNNLYANEFLKNAEFDFRRIYNDLTAEQLAIEHKIQQEQKALIEINGMTLRNHHNGLKQNKHAVKNKTKNMIGSLSIEKNNTTVIYNQGLLDNKNYSATGLRRRRKNDSDYFN